jgi:4-hydroxy-3-methylbut-2-enyl diphosphate reductase
MEVKLAQSYGFCFGVKRAIEIAQNNPHAYTMGPLIHNQKEIDRLKEDYNVGLYKCIDEVQSDDTVVIRTHGIPKDDLALLKEKSKKVINATCPFVTAPQQICKKMSKEGYSIVIFGDINHPEVQGVMSYADDVAVVLEPEELVDVTLQSDRIAVVAQTTRKKENFNNIINFLVPRYKEVRVFNTICDATFENQDSARELSKEVDIMIVIGGKNSSNTKQLLTIAQQYCEDSYLIESEEDLELDWFQEKLLCGVTAGASTPDWIISKVIATIKKL